MPADKKISALPVIASDEIDSTILIPIVIVDDTAIEVNYVFDYTTFINWINSIVTPKPAPIIVQTDASGAAGTTIDDATQVVNINPAGVIANWALAPPVTPVDEALIQIQFGGTLPEGHAVVNIASWNPATMGFFGSLPPSANSGDVWVIKKLTGVNKFTLISVIS